MCSIVNQRHAACITCECDDDCTCYACLKDRLDLTEGCKQKENR